MYGKVQDNISKWGVVEREQSTLEKDMEDQSKYYVSYPKPSVLDMVGKLWYSY